MNRNLARKFAVVTGGTDGIGKEIARGLAQEGIQVTIVGRNPEKGARAQQELRDSTQNPDVHFTQADLGLVSEANRLAVELRRRATSLHYLVHSAGILRGRHELTAEGLESNFAVNYLSRFALTGHLLPLLAAAGGPQAVARIVVVSGAAQHGRIQFDDVNLTSNFSTLRAVLQFCQANDVFTAELARRLRVSGQPPAVTVACLKIGVVKTNIRRGFPGWMKLLVPLVFDPLLGQTASEAADAALELLLAERFGNVSGGLFLKIKKFKQISPKSNPTDREDARRLWELSQHLTANAMPGGAMTPGSLIPALP